MSFFTDVKDQLQKAEKAVESSPVGPLYGEVMTDLGAISKEYDLTLEHVVSALLDAVYQQYGKEWLLAHVLNRPQPADASKEPEPVTPPASQESLSRFTINTPSGESNA